MAVKKHRETILDMSAEQLVDYLLRQWPARCIGPAETEVAAHRYAGKRELIENLKTRLNREKENYAIAAEETVR